jgi:hypothetical protein
MTIKRTPLIPLSRFSTSEYFRAKRIFIVKIEKNLLKI